MERKYQPCVKCERRMFVGLFDYNSTVCNPCKKEARNETDNSRESAQNQEESEDRF